MNVKRHWVLSTSVAMALVVAACGGDDSGSGAIEEPRSEGDQEETSEAPPSDPTEDDQATPFGAPVEGASLAMAGGEPDSIDPHKSRIITGYTLTGFLYDTLLDIDDEGTFVGRLAESWTEDASGITVSLHEGVTCADGAELTASAVKASFERFQSPDTGANVVGLFGSADFAVVADDEARTVRFEFPSPFTSAIVGLAHPHGAVICPNGLEDPDLIANPEAVIEAGGFGTGPYRLVRAVSGDQYVFEPRPEYGWGPDGATLDRPGVPAEVIVRVVANESTSANQLLAGELNIGVFLGADRDRVVDSDDLFLLSSYAGSHFLIFNQAPGKPAADPDVRRAVINLLNREEFAAAVTLGRGEMASSFGQPDVACATDRTIPDPDPTEALAFLSGRDLHFVFAGIEGDVQGSGPDYFVSRLVESGVSVEAAVTDVGTWSDTVLGGGDWDITIFSMGSSPSPRNRFVYLTGDSLADGGNNVGQVANEEAERLFRESDSAAMSGDFCDFMAEAEQRLIDDYDVLPIANATMAYAGNGATFVYGGFGKLIDPTSITAVQ